jgi:nucleoside-diphosphate-sugar epimerase
VRVVVTGATGNLGSRLVELLVRDPMVTAVVGLARRPPRRSVPGVAHVVADVRRDRLEPILEGADAVVHCAWQFQPTRDPVATWDNNVRGAERVFDATVDRGVGTLVHLSSVGAYRRRDGDSPVDEGWPTDALCTTAYGREKSYLERVLDRIVCQHPLLRVVRMRPAFLFRHGAAAWQWRLFAGAVVPPAAARLRPPVVPLPAGLRLQVLHTSDAAEAIRMALHRPVHGAFNLATDEVLGPTELAAELGGRPLELPAPLLRSGVAAAWHLRLVPTSPQLVDLVMGLPVLDSSRARTELSWTPECSATSALSELVAGLRAARAAAGAPPAAAPAT